ncbi:ImmA/IrrE family metallo-endopeptidase [Corynebacterium sp. CCUG 51687]|uniref:ImmA/IrrE family metallo-endopeptidase n=1 Tax=Corynebacterium sp. CCUG 51687 TaxID=2823897 RepID=UPI00210B08C3|nr:ImmA/IrrE family metallo-endopeptidase [Corynebacterium sp. CCUG 51687]
MAVRVDIAEPTLRWALQRTGSTVEELAQRSDFRLVRQWLEGKVSPTLRQAEHLASLACIPFGYLLLDGPTDDQPDFPDFRTVDSKKVTEFSPALKETIYTCERRLSWYAEFARAEGIDPPNFGGAWTLRDSPDDAVCALLPQLADAGWRPGKAPTGRENVLELADAIEHCGVLVMRNSVLGNNNHRKLDIDEFRAFTLFDGPYPLIFVNGSDYKVGQYFSLAHELGHVLLAAEGLTGAMNDHHDVERWCNRFAAALLLPQHALLQEWDRNPDLKRITEWAYDAYRVSADTALWSLVGQCRLGKPQVQEFLRQRPSNPTPPIVSGGGDFFVTLKSRLGGRFLDTVTGAYVDGAISEEEASRQLGIAKTETLKNTVTRAQGVA